ncbi:HAD family hydrolase [Corynebacterium xerosis]|uniref:HAD family hydrolase n=1 Tax=Corynebacterium xerosis TaxID=1725 RepID=UPI003670D989
MRAILWDMDGSLIDTEPLWEVATYDVSERLGRRLTPELRAKCIGNTLPDTIRICADHAGIEATEEVITRESEFMESRVAQLIAERGIEWRPGVRDIIEQAHEAGIPVVLVTNTRRRVADYCIDAMGRDAFADTVCGDEVPAGKPAPDPYLRGADIAGVDPADCLALEDSVTGVRSAIAAGCRVLWAPMPQAAPPADAIAEFAPPAEHLDGDLRGWSLDDLRAVHARLSQ